MRGAAALLTVPVLALVAAGCAAPDATAGAPVRASADAVAVTSGHGGVGPGAELLTEIGPELASCTANFVFTDGTTVYLGSAAHCHAAGESLDGCRDDPLPLGTPVVAVGADGTELTTRLAYSSWAAMQEAGETDDELCELNDLALLAVDPGDVAAVDPSVPVFGGPRGLDTDGLTAAEVVVSYQNAEDAPPYRTMRAKQGVVVDAAVAAGRGWIVRTTTPGLPGDSGSGYLDGDGAAFGVLSTEIELEDGSVVNGVTDLARALDYAAAHGGPDVTLLEGGPFSTEGVPMDELPRDRVDPRVLLGRGLDVLRDLLGAAQRTA